MSRIGQTPLVLPPGVILEESGGQLVVKGPKGELTTKMPTFFSLVRKDMQIEVVNTDKLHNNEYGLVRALLANMLIGVTKGWEKSLELIGVGYKAQGSGNEITLSVGFSHPVIFKAPAGINFQINANTKIIVSGIDKKLVGEVAAQIRAIRPPEPYKGKGIRYSGEIVRKKAGKAVKAAGVPGGA